jgi:nitroimidazol reductase NimA-like FMN-containing flavoprotein (pyridoxamine 5'-phosphate oxidase superfamily)
LERGTDPTSTGVGDMRRIDKEITDKKDIAEIVKKAIVCRIGLSAEGEPYVFPVNYGYQNGCLYFHSAQEGQKIEIMRNNPRVCFQMDTDVEFVHAEKACDWSIKYKSVIGFGKAEFLHSLEEKKRALEIIMSQYSDREYTFTEESLASVCIVCIHIEKMTGKKSGY